MRGDEGCEVREGKLCGLVFVPTPCPKCGAKTETEAGTICRPSDDQTGERYCIGEFDENGIAVQPTPESIAEMDAWIDAEVARMEKEERAS